MKLFFTSMLTGCLLLSSCIDQSSDQKSVNALTGGVDGGGGKGVLCDNQVSTLDLYEARKMGRAPLNISNDLEENLKFFGLEIAKHFVESTEEISTPQYPLIMLHELKLSIMNKFKTIPSGTHLPETKDATLSNLPTGCKMIQIAIFDDKHDSIYIDSEYWNKMPAIEQAGLIIHEWIYKRARSYGSRNSDETRKVIGQIFSGNNPEPILSPLWNATKKIECSAGIEGTHHETFEYFGIEEVQNNLKGVVLYFRIFKGVTLTSRLSAFIPGITLDQFLNNNFSRLTLTAIQKSIAKNWEIEIYSDDKSKFQMRAIDHNSQPLPDFSSASCRVI